MSQQNLDDGTPTPPSPGTMPATEATRHAQGLHTADAAPVPEAAAVAGAFGATAATSVTDATAVVDDTALTGATADQAAPTTAGAGAGPPASVELVHLPTRKFRDPADDQAVLEAAPQYLALARSASGAFAALIYHIEKKALYKGRYNCLDDYAKAELGLEADNVRKFRAAGAAVWQHYPANCKALIKKIKDGATRVADLPAFPEVSHLAKLPAVIKRIDKRPGKTPEENSADKKALLKEVAAGNYTVKQLIQFAATPRHRGDGETEGPAQGEAEDETVEDEAVVTLLRALDQGIAALRQHVDTGLPRDTVMALKRRHEVLTEVLRQLEVPAPLPGGGEASAAAGIAALAAGNDATTADEKAAH